MRNKGHITLFVLFFFVFNLAMAQTQLTAPGATGTATTEYPVFPETDDIFVFCAESEGMNNGSLLMQTELEGTKTFLWEKYNPATAAFDFYFSESTEAQESQISSLENGCFRATVTQGGTTIIRRGWVFNNSISATAEVIESNCESFRLNGSFNSSPMVYFDLADNSELEVLKDIHVEWKAGEAKVAAVISPQVFDPPAKNTDYTLRVYDRFGCETKASVTYESIVTKAQFSIDFGDQQGKDENELEAPLTVNFTNESENGDPGLYEWFFFKDLDDIKRESENTQQPIDSIMIVAYDVNPTYTYEETGTYMVKLVSKKASEFHTCVDTFYLENYITIQPSFIEAPNVFTPNGDGVNDVYAVKFQSMKSIKISIFNRWGKRVHFYESGDVRGFGNTYTATVWDGKLGGRYASPGVYYYVAVGTGRDDETRRARGFFHLFRDKD
ncbi:gliding motility-associated C-terminal domain-containing protein [Mariniphaga anaerophila]|uniref:Gliding motility-associated C-terminal domain-containing protein n=1 Tax=Mariniphaga anaerophila TaxID=1484053 RepID=A0A1M4XS64_9BACT|nr:gliding motility-associated C-terminal domain-containing protein [Mariniphaga anaerophila]SHE96311.1 gliding motility-associated C-terminal domain-containing protein [Mariniphaga anaerophila]